MQDSAYRRRRRSLVRSEHATPADHARFESKVDRSPGLGPRGDCHEWIRPLTRTGHGQFHLGTTVPAHRAAWFLRTGTWPPIEVLRACGNPACVRFEHLILGTLEARFELKVDRSPGLGPRGDCHHWTGSATPQGYGHIRPPGSGPIKLASHVAWFLETGEWPSLWVLHHCDNPPCVRVDHLFLGTQTDNMQDMARKGRSGRLRLSTAEVKAIRQASGEQREVAAAFGVSQATVWRIRHGLQRVAS